MYGLTLPAEAVERLGRGAPSLPAEGFSAIEAGRPLRLLGPTGEALGAGVADPENEVIRVWSREPTATLDAGFFRGRARAAAALRRELGLAGCFRLFNGDGDGAGGLAADVYGDYGVLYVYSRALLGYGRLLAEGLLTEAGLRGVVLKVRPRGGVKPGQVKQEIVGDTPPETMVAYESGVPFEVHLLAGLNVGLFTDMREHRLRLGRFVAGRTVLNTFAYTGALSVAAVRAGAREVTSVDLSSGVLKWASENFRRSGIDPERHRFEVSDVARFLKKERERGARYQTVILDPPTFSAARAHAWSMGRDYPDLIRAAADLLPETGGFLWVSSNEVRGKGVLDHVGEGLRRRDVRVLELGGLPPDYPTLAAWPEGRYLEVCWLWVG
jgi:23S rRNA (cytosine1962-C5)-methyltransferase